jgi:cytoskeletal protein RodZ
MSFDNQKNSRRKRVSLSGSWSPGVFIITSILLAGSGFFALTSSATIPMTTAAFAQEVNNTTTASTPTSTTATTTTTNSSSGIQLSTQPVMQEQTTTTSTVPINQTHMSATFSGNGTLTIPGTAETINYTSNGTGVIALETHSVQAEETLMTEQGESATATFYEIAKFDPAAAGEGKGLTMALIETDSTGTLASLNGTIVAGISDMEPNGETSVTLWEWESGIGSNAGATAAT